MWPYVSKKVNKQWPSCLLSIPFWVRWVRSQRCSYWLDSGFRFRPMQNSHLAARAVTLDVVRKYSDISLKPSIAVCAFISIYLYIQIYLRHILIPNTCVPASLCLKLLKDYWEYHMNKTEGHPLMSWHACGNYEMQLTATEWRNAVNSNYSVKHNFNVKVIWAGCRGFWCKMGKIVGGMTRIVHHPSLPFELSPSSCSTDLTFSISSSLKI